MRGLERRIVLDAAVALLSGSVDLGGFDPGSTVTVSQDVFDIDGDPLTDNTVYRFTLDTGVWTDGVNPLSGGIHLHLDPGFEAYVDGADLYVSAAFLETNAGGLAIGWDATTPTIVLTTDITTVGAQEYLGPVEVAADVVLTSGSGNITFGSTISGPHALSLMSDGVTRFDGNIDLESLTTDAGGQTHFETGVSTVVTSAGQTYGDLVILQSNLTMTASEVRFDDSLTGINYSLEIQGDAVIGDAAADVVFALNVFTINGDATLNAGSVLTLSTQTYAGQVTLGGDVILQAPQVIFQGSLDGGGHALTVNANASFGNDAGDEFTNLASLHAGGSTTITAGLLETTGSQTYLGDVTLLGNVELEGSLIDFKSNVHGAGRALRITGNAILGDHPSEGFTGFSEFVVHGDATINGQSVTGVGDVRFDGDVTLGTNVAIAAAQIFLDGNVAGSGHSLQLAGPSHLGGDALDSFTGLASLTVSGPLATVHAGVIETTGLQTYHSAVQLASDVELSASSVALNNHLVGNGHALRIDGSAALGSAIGNSLTGLASLEVTGAATVTAGTVTATGPQTYGGTVTLSSNATLTASVVSFQESIVGGTRTLTINGNAIFGNASGDAVTGLSTLQVTGLSTIHASQITTTGLQTYGGDVTLAGSTTLTGSVVQLQASVIGGGHALEIAGNAVFGSNSAHSLTGLSQLLVSGQTTIHAGDVASTGIQTYAGDVVLASDVDVTASTATFLGNVVGQGFALAVFGNAVFGDASTDSVSDLDSLTVTGTTLLQAGEVASAGEQRYGGNVTLAGDVLLAASVVSLESQLIGAGHSLEIQGDAVFGNDAGDVVAGLVELLVTGDATINASSIATTGSQWFGGDVTLGTSTTLAGSLVSIAGNIVGVGHGLLIDGQAVLGDSSSDSATALSVLQVTGATEINAGEVITIGNQVYGGAVTLGSNVELSASVVSFLAPVAGGGHSLAITGDVIFGNDAGDTVTGLASLQVTGASTINASNITSSGTQTYDGEVTLGENTTLTGSKVTFLAPVAGAGHSLVVAGDAVFGDDAGDTVTGLASLQVTGASTINASNITSTGAQTYDGAVTLGENATLTGSVVTFHGMVMGDGHALEIVGDVEFEDAVAGLTTLAVGGAALMNGGSIDTSGLQTYVGDVTLGADLDLTGSEIVFQSSVIGGGFALTIAGDAVLGNAAADTVSGLSALEISGATTIDAGEVTTTGTQTYLGAVTLGSDVTLNADLVDIRTNLQGGGWQLVIDGDAVLGALETHTISDLSALEILGAATLNAGAVSSTGSQTYAGDVTLGNDVTLSATTVTFLSHVIGAGHSLVINGDAVFGDAADDSVTGLSSLSVTGSATVHAGLVATTGEQTFDGDFTLADDTTLSASLVTFNGQVIGAGHSLVVEGSVVFGDEPADLVSGLATLNVTGDATINAVSVTSTGEQHFEGDVILGTTTLLSASLVTMDGDVQGNGQGLTIDGDAILGDSADNSLTGLASLQVTGTTLLNAGEVQSTDAQAYAGDLTLGSAVELTASLVTTQGQIIGGGHSLTVTGDVIFGNDAGDTVTGLASLQVTGTSTINTSNITSTGTQTYDGEVTLGENATLTGSTVAFLAPVIGAGHSLVVDGDAVFGDDAGDTVTGLASLQVTGLSTINTSNIMSTGVQTYDGEVTLGENATLTGSVVTFHGMVMGDGHSLDIDGDAVFGDDAADTVTGLSQLSITGATEINTTNITTSGSQTFGGTVTLGENATLQGSLVVFNGPVVGGNHSLTINGDALFGDEASDTVTGLTFLAVQGDATINTSQISTTGDQTFEGTVTLGEHTTLAGALVAFNGAVVGNGHSLTITGNARFGDEAGDAVTGLASLSVSGTSTINTSTVTSTGSQTYTGAVTIGAAAGTTTLTTADATVLFSSTVDLASHLTVSTGTGAVTFTGAVNGGRDLVVNSTGATTFASAVGATTALASVTTNAGGTTFLNGGSVQTTGDQTWGDHVSLGANTTLTGAVVTFNGTVSGNAHSLAITGDAVFGDDAGDAVTGLASLSVSGTTEINTITVTSTGSQTYTGAVTIGAPAGLATLSTTNSAILFDSTTTLAADLTVATGSGGITFTGAVDGPHDLVLNSTGVAAFNGAVGGTSPLSSLTTSVGGVTQINGGRVATTGDQLYRNDVQIGPGTQTLTGNLIHFLERIDGRLDRQGDLIIAGANTVLVDKAIGSVRDPGSVKISAVDITFADGTFIEVGKSAAESVHIVATGTLVLPVGFVVRAAYNAGVYDGVANTFLPRPAPGALNTALVQLPTERPLFVAQQNLDQSATGTITLPIGNVGERGLRVFIDWGDTVSQSNRFEGPGGWADGDGRGSNNAPGDLYAIEGGSIIQLTHRYTPDEVRAQLAIDNTFDVKYAVFQHEAIVIEAARVEQGAESLGVAGGDLNVLTTTMLFSEPGGPRFAPPDPSTVPNLVNGTVGVSLAPASGAVPFEFPIERPEIVFAPNNDTPPLDPLVTFQQVTNDESSSTSPVVGRQQRFVLRLLSPDPTAPPLAEVDLPADAFQADRLQRLFRELPDGAYEIDLLLGENTERPILRFDIRQGRPVVPQESLDGGQLRLEDIEETLKQNAPPTAPASQSNGDMQAIPESPDGVEESEESSQADEEAAADEENSSQQVRSTGTMSSRLEWQLRRRAAEREGSLKLASRLARRLST